MAGVELTDSGRTEGSQRGGERDADQFSFKILTQMVTAISSRPEPPLEDRRVASQDRDVIDSLIASEEVGEEVAVEDDTAPGPPPESPAQAFGVYDH